MNDQSTADNEITALPHISETILRRFYQHPPNFEVMYQRLLQDNPAVTQWLLAASERIAPADTSEKQRYATLALQLYEMLADQAVVNELRGHLNMVTKNEVDSPNDVESEKISNL